MFTVEVNFTSSWRVVIYDGSTTFLTILKETFLRFHYYTINTTRKMVPCPAVVAVNLFLKENVKMFVFSFVSAVF